MKQIFKKIAILTLGLTTLSSCLDQYPDNAIPEGESINTVNDVSQFVLGIYAGFKSPVLYSGTMTLALEIQADLVYAVKGFSNTYGSFWRWDFMPNDPAIESVYGALYSQIGRCNYVLENEAKVRRNTKDDQSLATLDEMIGDVYMARALAYSELIKLYCKAYDPATADKTLGVVLG